jgi:NADH-quinone oxidoreductase subunit J
MVVPMVTGAEVAFWLLAPVMVLAALGMILSRKPVHSALCLATVMISLAVQYAAQDAPFLFAVQIIVYTGAILMLFLFVLMLVGVDAADSLVETIKGQRPLAILAGLGFGALLVLAVGNAVVGEAAGLAVPNTENGGNVQGIAALLFNRYVFVFEATSALLITAAVGAMVLAHRERLTKKLTQADLVGDRLRRYAATGEHPGPLPTPGVFARHNAVDTPALLPDGSVSELSVSATLRARGEILEGSDLVRPIESTVAGLTPDPGDQDPPPHRSGPSAGEGGR